MRQKGQRTIKSVAFLLESIMKNVLQLTLNTFSYEHNNDLPKSPNVKVILITIIYYHS